GEALLLRGGTIETRVAVAWDRGSCSSRVFADQHTHLALNGKADEKEAKVQLSCQGKVFEGVARDSDKDLPFLRDLARAVDAQQEGKRIYRFHLELLSPLLPE